MSKFGWADGFWSLNPNIHEYAKCVSVADVDEMSEENQNQIFQNQKQNKHRNYDLPSSSES